MTGELIFEHSISTALIAGAVIAALAVAGFGFWRHIRNEKPALIIMALRLLFIFTFAWCLLMPVLKRAATETLKPRFIVALDVSASMNMTPSTNSPTRWSAAQAILTQPWAKTITDRCMIDAYPAAEDLGAKSTLDKIAAAKADGTTSGLKANLDKLAERYKGQNVCGLLFLSDGLDTREAGDDWASGPWPWPIYTVRLEAENIWQTEPDIRIDSVDTPRRVIVGWDTELKVGLSGQGSQGKPVAVQLYENDKLIQEAPVQIPDEGGSRPVTFRLEHAVKGSFIYTVNVPPLENEKRTNDNSYAVTVQVIDSKNRLLYLEGVPRWESKYLIRELKANKDIAPVCFVRGPGGRFMSTGTKNSPADEMKADQLANYKSVILGDLESAELGQEQAQTLVSFVENGGSLVMIGGAKAWGTNGYLAGPLEKIMPLKKTGGNADLKLTEGTFNLASTSEGQAHQVFMAKDQKEWKSFPPILSVFTGAELTAGATALLTTDEKSGRHPVVIIHKYGQGKVVAILTDSLWRWQLAPGDEASYRRFWNGLLFWLSPAEEEIKQWQIELFSDSERIFIGEQLHLTARIGGIESAPPKKDAVTCEILAPDGRKIPFTMDREDVTAAGGKKFSGFGINFAPKTPGLYRAVAAAELDGKKIVSEPYSFYVQPFTPESAPRPINAKVLLALANSSQGQFCEADKINGVLSEITVKQTEEQKINFIPLWSNVIFLACLLALLTLEWIIRKLNNMA